ncbi:lipopolysaccharide biosynthesis protein [Staphylococcus xylosus]|uniref:lipopolysaccharide biosynthesis protein n=1 Tax=Staphylococcus xylosus TaxID=1288 RepID=UPI0009BF32C3|nr:oligosaccharide flippase family protein [Staphylococcus xylosus]ARD73601.1 capsular biosynthesis protein [Staphylococcus xylosus]MCD8852817.1 oligosaccharide flippase family protein [Staphylococcus xylosus]
MKRIIGNFSYVFLANITNALSKFIYLIVITKFLTVKELGAYTLALAITAPIALFFNMKMRSYIISNDFIDYKKYTNFRKLANLISIIIIIIVSSLFYIDIIWIMILIAISKLIEINGEFYQAWPNKEKKFQLPSKLMIVRTLINILTFTFVALFTRDLIITLFINILGQLIMLFIERKINLNLVDLGIYRNEKLNYKLIFLTLVPLGIVQALMSFSTSLPKFLLDSISNIEAVGIYSAVTYFMTIISLFMASLNQTLLPYIKKIYKKNIFKFIKVINIYCNLFFLALSLIFLTLTFLFGDKLLSLIYTNNFAEYDYILSICAASVFFNMAGWMYDSALLLSNAIRYQPLFLIISMLITLGVGIILIFEFNILGATITLVVFQFLNTVSKAIYFNLTMVKIKKVEV